jgi:hypothetical protein
MKDKKSGESHLESLLHELKPVPARDQTSAARGKAEFLKQASEIKQAVSTTETMRQRRWNIIPKKENFAMNVFVSVLLALALLAGGGATAAAAQDDLPTQPLYTVKLFTEDARLMLNADPEDKIDMLMEMSQERVREMVALSGAGITPPNQVALRLEGHIRQALKIASTLEGEPQNNALEGIQTSLQTQEQILTRAQNQTVGESIQLMTQTQAMLQNRLRLVDEGLADPQGFQYTTQNERGIGQDESATPIPNQQGEPAYHQNDQAPEEAGNGSNGNGPKTSGGAPELEISPTPTLLPGQGPGSGGNSPGGNGQGGNN